MVDAGPRPGGQPVNLRPGQYPGKPTMFQDNVNANTNTGAQGQAQPANLRPGQYPAPPAFHQARANINANTGPQSQTQAANQRLGHGQSSMYPYSPAHSLPHGQSNGSQFVTNNLFLMDPALLQLDAGCNGAAPTFNFSPTSHAFSHFSVKHNEGAQGSQAQPDRNEPGKSDAGDQMDIRAQYADILGETVFDYDKDYFIEEHIPVGKPTDTLQPSSKIFDGTTDATHYHAMMQTQPAPHTSDQDHLVFSQQVRTNRVTVMPATHDTPMHGNDGQSVAGAADDAESAMSVPKDKAPRSNKRGLDADHGNSINAIDGQGENDPQTQAQDSAPKAKRPRTTKEDPKASVDASTHLNVKQPAALAQPTAQRKKSKKTKKTKKAKEPPRKQSLTEPDCSNVTVAKQEPRGMSRREAQEAFNLREEFDFDDDEDNVVAVKADSKKWIHAIMEAFDKPYSQLPLEKKFNDELIPEFQRWQRQEHEKVMERLVADESGNLVEACATVIYDMVIDAHENGGVLMSTGTSWMYDITSTCQQRFELIIKVLEACSIIRHDAVSGKHFVELVADPTYTIKRKEENKHDNERKKPENKARAASQAKIEPTDSVDATAHGDGDNNAHGAGEKSEGVGEKTSTATSNADESSHKPASDPTRTTETVEDADEEPGEEADKDDAEAAEGSSD